MKTNLLDIKEKQIETRLVNRVEKAGGIAWKFSSPQNASVPDRIVMLNFWMFFVELKRPGLELTEKQEAKFALLRERGVHCWCISNYEEVDFLVDLYCLHPGPGLIYRDPSATLKQVERYVNRR